MHAKFPAAAEVGAKPTDVESLNCKAKAPLLPAAEEAVANGFEAEQSDKASGTRWEQPIQPEEPATVAWWHWFAALLCCGHQVKWCI